MTRPVADLAATVRTRIKHTVRMKKAEVPTWSEALEALDELAARLREAEARATQAEDDSESNFAAFVDERDKAVNAEADAARLREERDAARRDSMRYESAMNAQLGLREAAEAEAARLRELSERQATNIGALYRQRRAAEARCAQLEQALAEIRAVPATSARLAVDACRRIAREALAGPTVSEAEPDTPADRQPECSLCHVPKATGDCQHIIANGDQVTMSRKAWERFTDELAESRNAADSQPKDTRTCMVCGEPANVSVCDRCCE